MGEKNKEKKEVKDPFSEFQSIANKIIPGLNGDDITNEGDDIEDIPELEDVPKL